MASCTRCAEPGGYLDTYFCAVHYREKMDELHAELFAPRKTYESREFDAANQRRKARTKARLAGEPAPVFLAEDATQAERVDALVEYLGNAKRPVRLGDLRDMGYPAAVVNAARDAGRIQVSKGNAGAYLHGYSPTMLQDRAILNALAAADGPIRFVALQKASGTAGYSVKHAVESGVIERVPGGYVIREPEQMQAAA